MANRWYLLLFGPAGGLLTALFSGLVLLAITGQPGTWIGGARVVAYDPVGRDQAEPLLGDIAYSDTAEAVADGADAVVVVTEWDEFRGLDLDDLAKRMTGRVLVDLRNIYDRGDAARAGLTYHGIGRAKVDIGP